MKKNRQHALISLIKEKIICTQEELKKELEKLGYDATQATISRDIRELKIAKSRDEQGNYRYLLLNRTSRDSSFFGRFIEIFSNSVISIDYAMNDVVIKCHPGTASAACAAFDSMNKDDVVGTLAGDDTFLVITRNESSSKHLVDDLYKLLK